MTLPTLMVNFALMTFSIRDHVHYLIFDILLRFRTSKIRLVADMKQAFLQINIAEEYRDYLRFIWFRESDLDENFILRFKRIVFGLTCSPFLLNATVKLHLEKFLSIESFKTFIEKLLLNLSVDDLSNSSDNIKDVINFYGNFILHKWKINCHELREFINTQSIHLMYKTKIIKLM